MGQIILDTPQKTAINRMKNGCILSGGVGSGKSRTSLAYYYLLNGGKIGAVDSKMKKPKDLYIITTARKRDLHEWDGELIPFLLSQDPKNTPYKNKVIIDSWNNIKKYIKATNSFFIFDEQRLVGSGTWVKTFLKIVKTNEWVILSATPGDTWEDYIPVFVANRFYKNKTEFLRRHAVYSRFTKFPKIDKFIETKRLEKLKQSILVPIDVPKHTEAIHVNSMVAYDMPKYKEITKTRWNPYKNEPIINAGALCYIWRKLVNSDKSRAEHLLDICKTKDRVIIFYNFDYELEILRTLPYGINAGKEITVAEWNGHKHEPLPDTKCWVYLVQYTAGCEGWECTSTDTIIFYSQNYSYKVMVQAAGRIDRRNTKYKYLYYYHLKSSAPIDIAIGRALKSKKKFNEQKFAKF